MLGLSLGIVWRAGVYDGHLRAAGVYDVFMTWRVGGEGDRSSGGVV